MSHLKLHTNGHLKLHSSGHLTLKRTVISTPSSWGTYVGGLSWGDTVAEAASGAINDLTQDISVTNMSGDFGVRWLVSLEYYDGYRPDRPLGRCQYEGRYWTLPVDSAIMSCEITESGSGTCYIGTSSTVPSPDPRNWTAGIIWSSGDGAINEVLVDKYIWMRADLSDWSVPSAVFERNKVGNVSSMTFWQV